MVQDSCFLVNDPTVLLRNDHTVLLGQLYLLAHHREDREDVLPLLQTFARDSTIHFRRETVLLDALCQVITCGGHRLAGLTMEHERFSHEVRGILAVMTQEQRCTSSHSPTLIRERLQDFVDRFSAHIRHEEMVVFVLAKTRLTTAQQRKVSRRILFA